MESASDSELLGDFAVARSEAAFRELVARHVDHVHSVAWRVTRSADLSADVAQRVFARLAERHQTMPRGVSLGAWLHTTTRSLAIDVVRTEAARKRREEEFHLHTVMNARDTPDWSEIEPVIDEAVESLPPKDREAILLRFYHNHTHAEVGRCLNLAEDAARMTVQRALEKLRHLLARKGITTTAAALAVTLPLYAVPAAPPALASSVATTALGAAGTAAATHTFCATAIAMTNSHLATAAAIAIAVPIIAVQFFQNAQLKDEAEALRSAAKLPAIAPSFAQPGKPSKPGADGTVHPEHTLQPTAAASATASTLREILAKSDPVNRIRALMEYAEQIPTDAIASVLKDLREGTPEWDPEAKIVMHMLLTRWARESPDAAYASLNSLDLRQQGGEGVSIVASLAALDPKRAVAWLQDPENKLVDFPFVGQILAGTIGKEWVRQDSAAALAWARSLPENQQGGAYVGVLGTLAGTDPAAAAALAAQLDPGGARRNVIGDIAESWARKSPQAALDWARSLGDDDGRTATRQALGGWALTEPAAAAAYLDQLPAADVDGELLKTVAGPWTSQAPATAATWLSARPEGDGKNQAMGDVMWNWTKQNPVEASTWLHDQPSGPARDAGINGLALATFDNDPEGALTWAASISDEKTRADSLAIGLGAWSKKDAAAAAAWAARQGVARK